MTKQHVSTISLTSAHKLSVLEVPEFGLKTYQVYLNTTLLNVCLSKELAATKVKLYQQHLQPLLMKF